MYLYVVIPLICGTTQRIHELLNSVMFEINTLIIKQPCSVPSFKIYILLLQLMKCAQLLSQIQTTAIKVKRGNSSSPWRWHLVPGQWRQEDLCAHGGGGHVVEEGMWWRRACGGGGHVVEEGMWHVVEEGMWWRRAWREETTVSM